MSALLRTSPRLLIPDRKRCRDYGVVWLGGGMRGGDKLHDVSPRKQHGTLTNGPTWTCGKRGEPAISFDGSDDHVLIDQPFTVPLTFSCWYQYSGSSTGEGLISTSNIGGYQEVVLYAYLTTIYAFIEPFPAANTFVGGSTSMVTGWNHCAITLAEGTVKGYLNGIENISTSYNAPAGFTKSYIGTRRNADAFYARAYHPIASPLVCNKALTANQIARLYRNPFYLYRNPPSQFNVGWAAPATTAPGAPTPRLGRRPTRFFRSSF